MLSPARTMATDDPTANSGKRDGWKLVLGVSMLWGLPLGLLRFPPMVDYPQQLALAAILRWYSDPARRFRATYELALGAPHGLWKLAVAGLAWALPIEAAGRLAVALSLAAVGPAALFLCRRTGRPAGYALLALALTYNYAFFWGFVDNLLAFPLTLAGLALADRLFEQPFTARSWLALALVTALFYTVHLQFLLIFAGAVGWLALARSPGWRRSSLWLSALLPGLAVSLGVMSFAIFRAPTGVVSDYERRLRGVESIRYPLWVKLAQLPDLLFGAHPDGSGWLLMALLLALSALVVAGRERPVSGETESLRELLFRTRFATLAGWLGLLYLLAPHYSRSYLIAERIAPLAAMVAVVALPAPAAPRRRLVVFLGAALLVLQLGQIFAGFLRFGRESAGLEELLAPAEPGQNLAGLIFDRGSAAFRGMPFYLHFPAYYQVEKGGRILFSFAELFHTSARFRPGQSWEDLLAEWNEWKPRSFDYRRHAARFRYFLVRGGAADVSGAFGPDLARLGLSARRAGEWWWIEPLPAPPAGTAAQRTGESATGVSR